MNKIISSGQAPLSPPRPRNFSRPRIKIFSLLYLRLGEFKLYTIAYFIFFSILYPALMRKKLKINFTRFRESPVYPESNTALHAGPFVKRSNERIPMTLRRTGRNCFTISEQIFL